MRDFGRRMLGAARLDAQVYEEVEHEPGANTQALLVVLLSGLALGIGGLPNSGPVGILWQTLVAVVGWYLWAGVACAIGTRLLPTGQTVADHGELLRTLGFSSAPGILRVAMLIPGMALPVFCLCTLWMLISMVVAVRQALDYESSARAVAVCALGFPIYAISLGVSILLLGPWPL